MKIAKLTPEQITTLKRLGIKGDTDEIVRPLIVAKLKDLDVEDVDKDPIEDLISILAAFSEIESPEPSKKVKAKVLEEEDEDEEELETEELAEDDDEIESTDQTKLAAKKPAKKKEVAKKATVKTIAKKFAPDSKEVLADLMAESKEKATQDKSKKDAVAASLPAPTGKKNFVDLKTNKDEIALAKKRLVAQFEKRGYFVTWGKKILSFSTKGTVSGRKIFTLDDLKINADNTFTIWLGFNAFRLLKNDGKDIETIKSFLSEDCADRIAIYSSGLCYAKGVTDAELKDFLPDALLDFADAYIKRLDDKLQKNRKKMEESITEKK